MASFFHSKEREKGSRLNSVKIQYLDFAKLSFRSAEPVDFATAYREFAPALYAWAVLKCRGPLGQAISPEDLVQEVCVEAMAAFPRFDPEKGAFRPWFFGVATRVASNALRRLARGKLLPGNPLDPRRQAELPAAVTTISRRVRRDDALERFVMGLSDLNSEEAKLLIYRGLEGLDHEAIGDLLQISPANAAKRWQRLRERLAQWPAARDWLHEL